jgi:hypothetical protein
VQHQQSCCQIARYLSFQLDPLFAEKLRRVLEG